MRNRTKPPKPFAADLFDTGDGHQLYYERYGHPAAEPLIYLHGGPGSGFNRSDRTLFDPQDYNILLFDQRGACRSRPYGEVQSNDMNQLVEDVEKLRRFCGFRTVTLAGVSFGSALAMSYAARYPQNVSRLQLGGVFFADREGAHHITEEDGVAATRRNIYFDQYQALIPPAERSNGLMLPYYRRLISGDKATMREAALRFIRWDMSLCTPEPENGRIAMIGSEVPVNIALARLWFHYAVHHFNGSRDGLLQKMAALNVPVDIVHGRMDHICPVENAIQLHHHCKNSTLNIVEGCGHWGLDLDEVFMETAKQRAAESRAHKKGASFRPPSPSF